MPRFDDVEGAGTSGRAALRIPARTALRRSPIQTERLLLVAIDAADGAELLRVVNGSRASLARWISWVHHVTTPGESARFAEACASDWDRGDALRFMIRDRTSRALVGMTSLELCDHVLGTCDLGYWLRDEATGCGLCTEAARATIDLAFSRMGARRVGAAVAVDNRASLRVVERLGFCFEGIRPRAESCGGRWLDHATFALFAPARAGAARDGEGPFGDPRPHPVVPRSALRRGR
jgi:ribosomal-protein-serine acetyltransferase